MKCGKPIRKLEEEFCFDCKKQQHFFEEGKSLWLHKEPVSGAIYAFKYHSLKCYGIVFGTEMAEQFADFLEEKQVEMLIPIPLHQKRKRERGYNQTEILAKVISDRTKIPVETNVLKRKKRTNPQKQLSDVERRKNIENAFLVQGEIRAKAVALIDDIYTTGSTLDEAAKTLKNAGVSKVYFLTISIGQGF